MMALGGLSLVFISVATAAAETADGAAEVTAEEPAVIFAIRHQSLADLMPSPKDANLRKAVYMLTDRFQELPAEITRVSGEHVNMSEIAVLLDWGLPLFASAFEYPAEFAIIDNGFNQYNARDIDVRLLVDAGDRATATALRDSLSSLLNAASEGEVVLTPSNMNPTMMSLQTPVATMVWGPVEETGMFVLGLDLGGDGLRTERVPMSPPAGFPEGVEPVFEMQMNIEPALDIAQMVTEMSGLVEGTMMIEQMKADLPESGAGISYARGYEGGRSVSVTRYRGWQAVQGLGAGMSEAMRGTINEDLLRLVPRDARAVQVNMLNLYETIEASLAESGMFPDPRATMSEFGAEVEREIGVNPVDDLLVHLGDAWAFYTADSTGGGGLLSATMVNDGVNGEQMSQSLQRLAAVTNAMAGQAMGYVHVSEWDQAEVREITASEDAIAWSLNFPGLPVPMELSMAVVGDSFIAGFSPQAIQAAAGQVLDGRASILNSQAFQRATEVAPWQDAIQLRYIDTQASIDRGYAAMLMGGSALGNFVRSPMEVERNPGMIVPPLRQLRRATFPTISVTRVEGEDIVSIAYADASWLANAAGSIGSMGSLPVLLPAFVGAAAAGAD